MKQSSQKVGMCTLCTYLYNNDDDGDYSQHGDDDDVMLTKRETHDGSIWPTDPWQFSFQLEHFVEKEEILREFLNCVRT